MGEQGQQIEIVTDNRGFARALSKVIGADASITTSPDGTPGDADLVIWRFDQDLHVMSLRRMAARVPTLVVAPETDLLRSVDAGVRGFVPSEAPLDQVKHAADTILGGGSMIPPELLGTLLRYVVDRRRRDEAVNEALAELSDREREVFELAASGARKDDIAEDLFISPATARTHLQRVYRKLGVHSQAELMARFAPNHTIQIPEE